MSTIAAISESRYNFHECKSMNHIRLWRCFPIIFRIGTASFLLSSSTRGFFRVDWFFGIFSDWMKTTINSFTHAYLLLFSDVSIFCDAFSSDDVFTTPLGIIALLRTRQGRTGTAGPVVKGHEGSQHVPNFVYLKCCVHTDWRG